MIRLLRTGLRPYSWLIVLVVILTLAQVIANLYLPTLNADIINNGVVTGDTAYILRVGAIMLAVTLVSALAAIASVYFGSKTSMGLGRDTRGALFRRVQRFSQAEVNRFGAPSLITRTTNDVQQVQMVVLMILNVVLMAPMMAIGGVIMALRLNVTLSTVILVAIPIMGAFIGLVITRATPLFMSMQKKIDRINQVTREFLSGVRVIRAFDRTVYEEKRFGVANQDLTDTSLKVGRLFALVFPAVTLIMNITTIAIMWFGGKQIADGSMPIGDLTAFLQYVFMILFSVLMATFMFVMVPRAAVSAQRIMEVLDVEPSIVDPERPAQDVPEAGLVEFRDVEFRYPGAEEPVLSGITFTARPGETTAVVGSTGNPGQANYVAAKAGLAGFTKALAQEVGSRNITVNCVAPGFIDTDMTRVLPEEQKTRLLERIPLGRLGSPEDIAEAVAYLVSDRAAYVTGTTLHVNGGLHMN